MDLDELILLAAASLLRLPTGKASEEAREKAREHAVREAKQLWATLLRLNREE